jgi:hypothetical protein
LRLVTIGLALGLAGRACGFATANEPSLRDPPVGRRHYPGTIVVLGSVALMATLAPVIRASRITPVTSVAARLIAHFW